MLRGNKHFFTVCLCLMVFAFGLMTMGGRQVCGAEASDKERIEQLEEEVLQLKGQVKDYKKEVKKWKKKYKSLGKKYKKLKKEKSQSALNENQKASEPADSPVAEIGEERETVSAPAQASETPGMRNALREAQNYLSLTAFSYSGLIGQLEFGGYSHEDAVYAADHCGADWYEQAAKEAASYLELTSFSLEGLIEQLEYSGYTHDEAVYGANTAYSMS